MNSGTSPFCVCVSEFFIFNLLSCVCVFSYCICLSTITCISVSKTVEAVCAFISATLTCFWMLDVSKPLCVFA